MTARGRRSSTELADLEEIARIATFEALQSYAAVPAELRHRWVLGIHFEGDDRVFELYVPGERPADALVYASARVNRLTRAVDVTVTNLTRNGGP